MSFLPKSIDHIYVSMMQPEQRVLAMLNNKKKRVD